MALNKSIELESGVAATYWKITSIFQDFKQIKTSITLGGYLNEEAREEEKIPLNVRTFNIDLIDPASDNIRKICYEYIVGNVDDFLDATAI